MTNAEDDGSPLHVAAFCPDRFKVHHNGLATFSWWCPHWEAWRSTVRGSLFTGMVFRDDRPVLPPNRWEEFHRAAADRPPGHDPFNCAERFNQTSAYGLGPIWNCPHWQAYIDADPGVQSVETIGE